MAEFMSIHAIKQQSFASWIHLIDRVAVDVKAFQTDVGGLARPVSSKAIGYTLLYLNCSYS